MIIDLAGRRAAEARLARRIGKTGYQLLLAAGALLFIGGVTGAVLGYKAEDCWAVAAAAACFMPATWWKRHLSPLPAIGNSLTEKLSADVLARLKPGMPLSPATVWEALGDHWQSRFIMHHLLLPDNVVAGRLSVQESDLAHALQVAEQLATSHGSPTIEVGFVVAGILASASPVKAFLTSVKARPDDILAVTDWLGRNLVASKAKHVYGGIGRDWAFGFTPVLDRLGENVSLAIAQHGASFGALVDSAGVKHINDALATGATAVALVGPEGIGKTTSVYALAQRLIEGTTGKNLAYHQVVSLNATDLVARARGPGEVEHLMLSIANEAAHAGHIILFFDNAQLFFSEARGSFDASQILLSIMEARTVPIILALTPEDFQRLKQHNTSMAGLLSTVILQEPDEAGILRVLEDMAIRLENRSHILVSYQALKEAFVLSGRYEQSEAYPGKAIKLLEQSVPHAQQGLVTAASVQAAIEKTRGVKVSAASPAEADSLLRLEDRIHERMVNQTQAVSAVASALRRARAGVTNPKRPIGSFLFLGPTGVGKTELAKAVAATYFGNEQALIRLDMSEYQQPDDVQRLLATGQNEASSLLLSIRQQPFAVVLLDELEKAHPNVLNLLLQMLDEGQLTDTSGRAASFRDCVIIATSNAGAAAIRERVGKGEDVASFASQLTDELIKSGQFKPELLNRFDEMVLFRPLTPEELTQVVQLMLREVNATLAQQNITVELTPAAVAAIVERGNDPRLGARPLRRMLQRTVEDTLAKKILSSQASPGDKVVLDVGDLDS